METNWQKSAKVISIDQHRLRAVQCEQCGAKMYPTTLLEIHRTRHLFRERRLHNEIKKLQHTFSRMRDIA